MRLGKRGAWSWVGLLIACFGLCLVVSPVLAQEGGPAPAAETAEVTEEGGEPAGISHDRKSGFVEFFEKGGDFMWPLLLLAVLGLAVILERLITLQRSQTNTRRLMAAIVTSLKSGGVEGAQNICMNTRGPIAAILHAGLEKVGRGPAAVEKAIENSGAIEMAFLQRGLPVLSTVANIAPLLGFLGTVSGMIHAFEAIAAAEQVSAKVVASGISEALITTMTGLIIAIPAQAMYNFFVARIDRFVLDMEESSVELLDVLTEEA
jgi:biopolymer transport protein ExbB